MFVLTCPTTFLSTIGSWNGCKWVIMMAFDMGLWRFWRWMELDVDWSGCTWFLDLSFEIDIRWCQGPVKSGTKKIDGIFQPQPGLTYQVPQEQGYGYGQDGQGRGGRGKGAIELFFSIFTFRYTYLNILKMRWHQILTFYTMDILELLLDIRLQQALPAKRGVYFVSSVSHRSATRGQIKMSPYTNYEDTCTPSII